MALVRSGASRSELVPVVASIALKLQHNSTKPLTIFEACTDMLHVLVELVSLGQRSKTANELCSCSLFFATAAAVVVEYWNQASVPKAVRLDGRNWLCRARVACLVVAALNAEPVPAFAPAVPKQIEGACAL